MGWAHPVQSSICGAHWRVEIELPVDVEQAWHPGVKLLEPGHDRQRDRTVAAKDENRVAGCEQRADSNGERLKTGHHLRDILSLRMCAIGLPYLRRQVSVVMHVESRTHEGVDQTSRPQGGRCLLLPGSVATSAIRNAYD